MVVEQNRLFNTIIACIFMHFMTSARNETILIKLDFYSMYMYINAATSVFPNTILCQ